jgi:hypothetical protein
MKPIFLSLNVERWTLDARYGGARPRWRRVGRLEEAETNAQRPTLNVQRSIRQ